MGRFLPRIALAVVLASCSLFVACGHSSTTVVSTGNAVPTSVSLTANGAVGSNVSVEIGKTTGLTPTAFGANNRVITESFSFQSSDPTIVSVASNGNACAGAWDSLTAPTVCTPGNVGVAQITAVAQGVSSPPLNVYVHQRVTNVVISKAPSQTATLFNICLSKGAPTGPESWVYEATALNGSNDITSTVGPFAWQQISPTGSGAMVTLTTPPTGSPLNQEIITASTPGQAMLFASANGFNSPAVPIETCPVQTISIATATGATSPLVVSTGTSTTLNASATDILGMPLTGVALTWCSSNPISVTGASCTSSASTSTVYASTTNVSGSTIGAGDVTASCTPPTCNGGIKPSLPIYPLSPITFEVSSSSAPASPTAYVTTTACTTANPTGATCNPAIIPITKASSTASFTTGSPVALPFSPNSFVFAAGGSAAYLGVKSSHFNQNGVMVFTGSSVSPFTNAAGNVLAVSSDGTSVIISDTFDSPNQVFVCTNCTTTGRTITSFLISGATAAAFSPDNLKAYIAAGTNLYVYSKLDAMQKIANLSAVANDVAFLSSGMAGYIAGGDSAGGAFLGACDVPSPGALNPVPIPSSLPGGAKMIRSLPRGNEMLALAPPNVFTVSANVTAPMPGPIGGVGCPSPRGFVSITNTVSPAFDLGQGAFNPTQLMISPDGSTAYILGQTNGSPLPVVIAFNLNAQTASLISLADSASPLSASLSPAGDFLFVGATDGAVHIIATSSGSDTQQITFPFSTAPLCFGPGNPVTQVPKTSITVTSASINSGLTTYGYTLVSGPALQVGESITISGMQDGGNNGAYTISSLGAGTFTVTNQNGVTTSSTQNGLGIVPITCNPDLVAVRP